MVRNQIVKYYVIMALLTNLINRYLSIVTPLIETPQAHLNFHITAFLTRCVLWSAGRPVPGGWPDVQAVHADQGDEAGGGRDGHQQGGGSGRPRKCAAQEKQPRHV